jgi:CxxC motif-containing protein (DUF1111 family)
MRGFASVLVIALAACGDNDPGEQRQGGATTVDDRTINAFTHPAANLTKDDIGVFQDGKGPFDFQWEIPQLGPQYNNDQCFGCHSSNGRGRAQIGEDGARIDINGPQSESLVRVSAPTGTPSAPGGDIPLPGFGLQLHDRATTGVPQVFVTLSWIEEDGAYGDGMPYTLRHPSLDIRAGDGTSLPADTQISYRTAPQMIGLGLLEAIDESTLEALEDPDDANHDGISGRRNLVWNPDTMQTETGRFGWKANAPNLRVQAAGAAVNDMGLTNKVFPPADGSDSDMNDTQLDQMTFMVSTIAVPAAGERAPIAWRGREMFDQMGCSGCHVTTLVTGASSIPQLAGQEIHPFTDMLLHDMGDGLADNRPDFGATGSEWRTTPLWGIGLAQVVRDTVTFLHDGRARTLEEAILWHGGEAEAAREAFRTAAAPDRHALIAFLTTL